MNSTPEHHIPRDCRLPSLDELLQIDAEEEARMARWGDSEGRQDQKRRQSELERFRKRMASQLQQVRHNLP